MKYVSPVVFSDRVVLLTLCTCQTCSLHYTMDICSMYLLWMKALRPFFYLAVYTVFIHNGLTMKGHGLLIWGSLKPKAHHRLGAPRHTNHGAVRGIRKRKLRGSFCMSTWGATHEGNNINLEMSQNIQEYYSIRINNKNNVKMFYVDSFKCFIYSVSTAKCCTRTMK